MEFETYEEVIDAYNSGVGVEAGETLTDYIKRNNIKIKEVEIDNLDNLEGSRPMEKEGVMQLASGNMDIRIEEVVKEFIKQKGRRPRSLEEMKEFYQMEMTGSGGASNRDNVSLASYEPGKYAPEEIEMYEQYKYDMNEQRPGMPIMEIDDFLRMELGSARAGVQAGGLPGLLGV